MVVSLWTTPVTKIYVNAQLCFCDSQLDGDKSIVFNASVDMRYQSNCSQPVDPDEVLTTFDNIPLV